MYGTIRSSVDGAWHATVASDGMHEFSLGRHDATPTSLAAGRCG